MGMPAAFHELARKVNNWGRWGSDDEIGTLNLITDEVVREGVPVRRRLEAHHHHVVVAAEPLRVTELRVVDRDHRALRVDATGYAAELRSLRRVGQ